MNNRLNFDEILNTYEKEFYIKYNFRNDWEGNKVIAFSFNDIKNKNNVEYFYICTKWHPRKREIEYDENQFNLQIKLARQTMRRNRMKRKLYRIKKDFE